MSREKLACELILPNCGLVNVVFGPLNSGVLVKLRASARNCALTFSAMENVLNGEIVGSSGHRRTDGTPMPPMKTGLALRRQECRWGADERPHHVGGTAESRWGLSPVISQRP